MPLIPQSIYQWTQANKDIVFFVYGLAFVVMGIAVWIQPKRDSKFELANILWLLSGFGLIHGTNELLDMWAIIKGRSPVLDIARSLILIVSYLFLFEFGRRILRICKQKYLGRITELLAWWLTLFIGIAVFVFGFISTDFWKIGTIWSRYLLGFPGGILISFGFILYYQYEEERLGLLKVKKYFFLASLSFLIYGILGGLVVPKAGFFPASWINTDSFLLAVQLPVQAFRALCAVIIAWSVYGILRIFNWETVERLQTEISERKLAEDSLQKAYDGLEIQVQERTKELSKTNELLKIEIDQRRQAEEENKRNYDIQKVLNSLLNFSLKAAALDEILNYALGLILSIPWLSFESRGSIFIVEDEPQTLVMKAQKGISAFIQESCARVPFGKCLCGQAALTKKIQFIDHLDERHKVRYKGIIPHGHYCVPIMSSDKVLGVLNIYIKEAHPFSQREQDFLIAISNTLAGVIERKKAEEQLKNTQDQLIQAEKLNAVGLLASGVAHEVRNPLGIIIQGINYLEKKISTRKKDIFETLAMLKESINRADKIVNGLLDFSRATALDLQPEDINSILEKSLSLVKKRFEFEHIAIVKELKADLPRVLADRNKIEQVCVNILLNAAQAMPEGGKIIIRSYDKELREIKNGVGNKDEDYFKFGEKAVMIEFEDTGVGIPEKNIGKIFDPFFTSKGPKGGTGLGLSVSRNIVYMHKGLIYAQSRVGKGTKITIVLKIAGK